MRFFYVWRGYDVFRPGAVKGGDGDYAVVHITDKLFTLGTFNANHDTWNGTFEKSW